MLKILGFHSLRLADIRELTLLNENRKKSPNMLIASVLAKKILAAARSQIAIHDLDLIFCSGEGELQQTFDYFKGLTQGLARPILFQNSLHNSTLGSLTLEIEHLVAGHTISDGDLSFEAAIDMALATAHARPVLIIGVDVYNEELQRIRSQAHGPTVTLVSGGCGALFVPAGHPEFAQLKAPCLRDLTLTQLQASNSPLPNHYPANGLEVIAEQIHLKEFSYPRLQHQVHVVMDA